MKATSYDNVLAQQNTEFYPAFKKLFDLEKPARILEIGTGSGGATLFMKKTLNDLGLTDTIVRSYDMHNRPEIKKLKAAGVDIRIENIFNSNRTQIINVEDSIDFIQGSGTSIVLCDGGDKIREFNLLSKYIKKGDIIMAHDYCNNKENFEKNIKGVYWNHMEISDKDIKDACERENLETYDKIDFTNAVWVCKIKK